MLHVAMLAFALSFTPAHAAEKEVHNLSPLWLTTELRRLAVEKAAIGYCGNLLHSCEDARRFLREYTAQCSQVFLGLIDLDKHRGAPTNLYDAPDPRIILLMKLPGEDFLSRIGIMAATNPDTVAIVLCPEESRVFGHVLRMLRSLAK